VEGWDVSYRVIANDATPEILGILKDKMIPHSIYNDSNPEDYYLNRVYRAWNYGGTSTGADNICYVNSDMVFSDGWLDALLARHDGVNIPCSRLIESGKLPSGMHAKEVNFGRSPSDMDHQAWCLYAEDNKQPRKTMLRGLFQPVVFESGKFSSSGGYPEGNIYEDGVGTCNGRTIQSGDAYYFYRLEKEYGMKHITVFDSLVYHIQEGEKDA
jgi:hypothetical protein